MQTFMPHPNYADSARTLDRQRLGKQRVEGLQIFKALNGGGGWQNHPAVKMWRGFEGALAEYVLAVCQEWTGRGYKDTIADRIRAMVAEHPEWRTDAPPWVGDPGFHASHQSNFVRKDAAHYGPMFDVGPDLPYVWPV